jgi:hypothetical protein
MTDTTSNPSSGLWVTPAELHELTGYKHAKRQKMALGQMNVPFRSRAADGYPLVDRALFESAPLSDSNRREPRRRAEPRLDVLRKQ